METLELALPKAEGGMQMPAIGIGFTRFSPGRAAFITGASLGYQGDLRRRGLLAYSTGQARFDLFAVVYLMALKTLAARGGPKAGAAVAPAVASGIAWQVLRYPDAYAGDFDKVLTWDRDTFTRIEASRAARAYLHMPGLTAREMIEEVGRLAPDLDGYGPGLQADWLRRAIFQARGVKSVPAAYFLWWADDTYLFTDSIDAAFKSGVSDDPRYASAVLVLDLAALAAQIELRAGTPFVRVSIAESSR
jgi:hypothetical protein